MTVSHLQVQRWLISTLTVVNVPEALLPIIMDVIRSARLQHLFARGLETHEDLSLLQSCAVEWSVIVKSYGACETERALACTWTKYAHALTKLATRTSGIAILIYVNYGVGRSVLFLMKLFCDAFQDTKNELLADWPCYNKIFMLCFLRWECEINLILLL